MTDPYYEDKAVTLYHGDCIEILPTIGQVDHVITDPPYEAEAHTLQRRQGSGVGSAADRGERITFHPLGFDAITDMQRHLSGMLMGDAVRRWCLIFCQIEASQKWTAAVECGLARYIRTCIWRKVNGCPQFTGDRPGMGYETIVACHGRSACGWNGGGRHGVFDWPVESGKHPHPTTKPLGLMKELVSLFTDPGETILDPFAGSGTTLRAAKDLGRKAIGVELNREYCDIAVKRLRQEVLL